MDNKTTNARFEFTTSTITDAVADMGIVAAPHGTVTLTADPDGRVTVMGSDGEQTLTVPIDAVAARGRLVLHYWRVGGSLVVTLRCGEVVARLTGLDDDRGLRAQVDERGAEELARANVDRAALLAQARGIEQLTVAVSVASAGVALGSRHVAAETTVVGNTSQFMPLDLSEFRHALSSLTADRVELRITRGAAERKRRLVVTDAAARRTITLTEPSY